MTIEIRIPDIGSDEVDVTQLFVKVGELVQKEQPLLLVEGDKTSMEVPAEVSGTVQKILIKVGDKVSSGTLVMEFAMAEDASASAAPSRPSVVPSNEAPVAENASSQTAQLQDVLLPDVGGSAVNVTEILVKVGDVLSEQQPILTVEGDKASMEVPTSQAGVVQKIYVALSDSVVTGAPIIQISAVATAEQKLSVAPAVQAPAQPKAYTQAAVETPAAPPAPKFAANGLNEFVENSVYVHASPVVRRLAREFGVDLSKVVPTGLKNRIQKQDVQHYVKAALAQLSNGPSVSSNGLSLLPWPKVDFTQFGEIESVPLSRIKKLSGANLARNWAMIPHVTQFDEADITGLEAFRQEQNSQKSAQVKLTPLVFILKAVAKALQQFPEFNASLSEDGQDLLLKKYINIGVAVDTPAGLVVPVINDVPAKGVVQLSLELAQLSQKAREGKLTRTDLQGGCFTISSLGGVGGTAFTPIINAPEVAILGVSKSQHKPVWNGHEFTPRLMLPLSLSFDHRVIDGVQGARFITYLNQCLSDLRLLLL